MNRTYLIVSNLLLSANSDQKRVQRFWLPPKTDRAAHESNVRQILGGMVGPQTTFHWGDKNPHAVALGRLGGLAGTGDSKRRNVSPEQARAAVNSRWARKRAAQAEAAEPAMPGNLVAFDYESQQWVKGEAAKPVRAKQINEELTILTSSSAENFMRFNGLSALDVDERIATLRAELASLTAKVGEA